MKYILCILLTFPLLSSAQGSVCFGSTSSGKLDGGVQLPVSGDNYVGYSLIARAAGRTYVHSAVHDIVIAAYAELETSMPSKKYKYAETGFESGGEFNPHKTHRNGLSVDFMTPVVDKGGNSAYFSTTPLNKFGYDVEFDSEDMHDGLVIDYTALAAHIVALHKAARNQGYDLWRVIFDPKLQPKLFKTKYGGYLAQNIQFTKKRSWVRHDEHYHVDFNIPCQ